MWYRKQAQVNNAPEEPLAQTEDFEVEAPAPAPPPAPAKFEYPSQLSTPRAPITDPQQYIGMSNWVGTRGNAPSNESADVLEQMRAKKQQEIEELKNRVAQGLAVAQSIGFPTTLFYKMVSQVSVQRLLKDPEYQAYAQAHGDKEAKALRTNMQQLVWDRANQFNHNQVFEAKQSGVPFNLYVKEVGPIDIHDILDLSEYTEVDQWGMPQSNDLVASGVVSRYFLNRADNNEETKAARNAQLASPLYRVLNALGLVGKSSGSAKSRAKKMMDIINAKPLWKLKEEYEEAAGDPELQAKISSEPRLSPLEDEFQTIYKDGFRGVEAMEFAKVLAQFDPELAEAFLAQSSNLSYQRFAKRARAEPDTVYGDVFGLKTLSNPEREIMEIFRDLGLQPVPKDITMQAQGKDVWGGNEFFKLDFLLPCDVWKGDEDLIPVVERQVIFIGEYFGMSHKDYHDTKMNKKLIEPFQASIAGGDTLFIEKNSYSKEDLKKLLDAKGIIYKGSMAEEHLQHWVEEMYPTFKTNSNDANLQQKLDEARAKISSHINPETSGLNWLTAYIETVKMELQMQHGWLGKFKENANSPDRQQIMSDMYQYQLALGKWYEQEKDLRAKLRVDMLRLQTAKAEHAVKPSAARERKLKEASLKVEQRRDALRSHARKFHEIEAVKRVEHYRNLHQQMLAQSDYPVRLQELNTLSSLLQDQSKNEVLQNLVDTHIGPSVSPDKRVAVFVKAVCDNAVKGNPFNSMLGRSAVAARLARVKGMILDPVVASWLAKWPDR